jgi:DNA invertase Pin-like site-specific DNA recombinase
MEKAVIYARVSSKEQEETGYSLDSQEKLLRSYSEQHGFKASKLFRISESASGRRQRETFSEMIKFMTKSKINILICEKVDRLTRNFKDAIVIDDWLEENEGREVHLVKDSLKLSSKLKDL